MSYLIKCQHLYKSYSMGGAELPVLNDINLHVTEGDSVAVMGASGSGKSTLLHILGLLDKPDSGQYFFRNQSIDSLSMNDMARLRNTQIGFVFQSFYLLPRMNALQNVMLPLIYRGDAFDSAYQSALDALSWVGLENGLKQYPNQLSGGQQQRVAIARAMVTKPKLILADEPTGALDRKTGQMIMNLLTHCNQHDKTTLMIITHDPQVAEQCQHIYHIHDGNLSGE